MKTGSCSFFLINAVIVLYALIRILTGDGTFGDYFDVICLAIISVWLIVNRVRKL